MNSSGRKTGICFVINVLSDSFREGIQVSDNREHKIPDSENKKKAKPQVPKESTIDDVKEKASKLQVSVKRIQESKPETEEAPFIVDSEILAEENNDESDSNQAPIEKRVPDKSKVKCQLDTKNKETSVKNEKSNEKENSETVSKQDAHVQEKNRKGKRFIKSFAGFIKIKDFLVSLIPAKEINNEGNNPIQEPKQTSVVISSREEQESPKGTGEGKDTKLKNPSIAQKQSTTETDSTEPKGFIEQIKELSEVLKAIAYIGSAIVLILSVLKIYSNHLFYGVPVLELTNISVLYTFLIHVIVFGIVIFLVFCNYYLSGQSSIAMYNDSEDIVSKIMKPILIITSAIMLFVIAEVYIFNTRILSRYLANFFKSPVKIEEWIHVVYLGVLGLFCISSIILLAIERRKNKQSRLRIIGKLKSYIKNHITIKKIKKNKPFKKGETLIKKCLHFSVTFIVVAFFLSGLGSIADYILPYKIHNQEIVLIDSSIDSNEAQQYVTVCNSSNGKLVVKCDRYYEDKQFKLVVYRCQYKFIDPKNYTFDYLYCNDIITEDKWYAPVKTNDGTEAISLSLSDKARGKGNYDLSTSFCHYLYLEITNNDDKTLRIGDTYMLEIHKYGQWRSLPLKTSECLTGSACIVEPKQTSQTYFDVFEYGNLEPGRYRIALSSSADSASFYYVEFDVDKEGIIKELSA